MPTAAKHSTTVRISETAHDSLRELASKQDEPMQAVLDKAIEQYSVQTSFGPRQILSPPKPGVMPNIYYGDVLFGNVDPTVGHEQAGRRPMLVTTSLRPFPSRVLPPPPCRQFKSGSAFCSTCDNER